MNERVTQGSEEATKRDLLLPDKPRRKCSCRTNRAAMVSLQNRPAVRISFIGLVAVSEVEEKSKLVESPDYQGFADYLENVQPLDINQVQLVAQSNAEAAKSDSVLPSLDSTCSKNDLVKRSNTKATKTDLVLSSLESTLAKTRRSCQSSCAAPA